jgi:hypothetical protein
MKPRHAAALALVGWYLMMPSPQMAIARRVDPSALGGWFQIGVYDTSNRYMENLGHVYENFHHPIDEGSRWALDRAQCIATDDPRLKEK